MKRIIALVLLVFITSASMGKQDRDQVFQEVVSPKKWMIWERDDNYFGWFSRWFSYAKYVRVIGYNIQTDWDKDKRQTYIDTCVIIMGKDHTCESFYRAGISFDDFYKGYDLEVQVCL